MFMNYLNLLTPLFELLRRKLSYEIPLGIKRFTAEIYFLKVNYGNTKTVCKIYSKFKDARMTSMKLNRIQGNLEQVK